MKAKLVIESVGDVLKPKSEEDIINVFSKEKVNDLLANISKQGSYPAFWKSLIGKVNPEEMFRIALNSHAGVGLDVALQNGAKGDFVSDYDLIKSSLHLSDSNLFIRYLVDRIPFKTFMSKIKDFHYSSYGKKNSIIEILMLYLEKNDVPDSTLYELINLFNSDEFLDFLVKKNPNLNIIKIYNDLKDEKTGYYSGNKTVINPLKAHILNNYADDLDTEFVIKESLKYKLDIASKYLDHLKDYFSDEQILKIALENNFSNQKVKEILNDVDLSKIKPNLNIYKHLIEINDLASMQQLVLHNKKNTPALISELKKLANKLNPSPIKNLILTNTSGQLGSPNARQGAAVKDAIKGGNIALVKQYLNHKDISKNTLQGSFDVACKIGTREIIRLFLDDSHVNPIENFPTCLMNAAEYSNVTVLEELIKDPRIKNKAKR